MDILQCNLLVKIKRKWKSRWVVLRRVNPGSDRINLYVYKDRLSAISKHKEKFLLSLRDFCAIESIDKENKFPKLVIITALQPLSLRFEKKENRDHWVDTIFTEGRYGEDVTYDGIFPSRHPLKSGEVTLHIYPNFFALVRKQNLRCIGRWKFEQLFNYGPVDGGFIFRIENEADKDGEPESFLLVTSLEKQINRTFDTVYKTAHHMYGSAEGLERTVKANSPRGARPRSMSEPSGFKRFMQRLSIRRKSRRPKSPRWLEESRPSDNARSGSLGYAEQNAQSGKGSKQLFTENGEAKSSENQLSPGSPDDRKSEGSATSSASLSPGISPFPSIGVLSRHVDENTGDISDSRDAQVNGVNPRSPEEAAAVISSHEQRCETDGGENSCENGRKSDAVNGLLSLPGNEMRSDDDDDPTVWQRRSALFLNTDDMIREGLMKPKQCDRRVIDPAAQDIEGNNSTGAEPSRESSSVEGSGIQARRNTAGNRGKRPMLSIKITPSEPSSNQYVNLPENPKGKQVARLKPTGVWDRYDSEENVYHHLAAVVGQNAGYQNLPGSEDSQSQNFPGPLLGTGAHSYENVSGDMHYINVDVPKPQPHSVNYIKLTGSGPPTPVQKNSNSFKSRDVNPDYTEIDIEKTKRLRELSREAKKPLERAKKP